MRIYEIVFWNSEHAKRDHVGLRPNWTSGRSKDDLTNLANAFTKGGLVKHLWNLARSQEEPPGPAPPLDVETEATPSGTLEPTMTSVQDERVEEPLVDQYRLVPFRRHQGV
jgi:hypothetical protein